jgi:arylsulfatase A-like enzyme
MSQRPNVVILVLDTARYDVVARLASDPSTSLGSLAKRGTQYTQASATAPWTLPSHASLFTGTYPSRHGAHAGHKRLDDHLRTLPEILSESGYETVAVSNNTWISDKFGFANGFEMFHKTWQYIQTETDLGKVARQHEGVDKIAELGKMLFHGNLATNLVNAVYGKYFRKQKDDGASRTNDIVAEWLNSRSGSSPFFLFVNYLEPHLEYRPQQEYAEQHLPADVTYDEAMTVPQDAWGYIAGTVDLSSHELQILRSLYHAEIMYLDDRIGEIKKILKETGEWKNTIIILTSDHGEHIGEHGLMDHQYALYETLLHVPLIVCGGPFESSTNDAPVQLVDIAPTVLETIGIEHETAAQQFQGKSFHPDAGANRSFSIAEYMAPQPSMTALERRVGDLPEQVTRYDRSLRSIKVDGHKFIRGSDGMTVLYDLDDDPDETSDLSGESPTKTTELAWELDQWLDSFEQYEAKSAAPIDDDTRSRLEDLGYLQ